MPLSLPFADTQFFGVDFPLILPTAWSIFFLVGFALRFSFARVFCCSLHLHNAHDHRRMCIGQIFPSTRIFWRNFAYMI